MTTIGSSTAVTTMTTTEQQAPALSTDIWLQVFRWVKTMDRGPAKAVPAQDCQRMGLSPALLPWLRQARFVCRKMDPAVLSILYYHLDLSTSLERLLRLPEALRDKVTSDIGRFAKKVELPANIPLRFWGDVEVFLGKCPRIWAMRWNVRSSSRAKRVPGCLITIYIDKAMRSGTQVLINAHDDGSVEVTVDKESFRGALNNTVWKAPGQNPLTIPRPVHLIDLGIVVEGEETFFEGLGGTGVRFPPIRTLSLANKPSGYIDSKTEGVWNFTRLETLHLDQMYLFDIPSELLDRLLRLHTLTFQCDEADETEIEIEESSDELWNLLDNAPNLQNFRFAKDRWDLVFDPNLMESGFENSCKKLRSFTLVNLAEWSLNVPFCCPDASMLDILKQACPQLIVLEIDLDMYVNKPEVLDCLAGFKGLRRLRLCAYGEWSAAGNPQVQLDPDFSTIDEMVNTLQHGKSGDPFAIIVIACMDADTTSGAGTQPKQLRDGQARGRRPLKEFEAKIGKDGRIQF